MPEIGKIRYSGGKAYVPPSTSATNNTPSGGTQTSSGQSDNLSLLTNLLATVTDSIDDVIDKQIRAGLLVTDAVTVARLNADNNFGGHVIRNARLSIVNYEADHTLSMNDKGAYLKIDSTDDVTITLPSNWHPGDWCVIFREGEGHVFYEAGPNAEILLPASRSSHERISEQFEEITVRVVRTSPTGIIWSVTGATAPLTTDDLPSIPANMNYVVDDDGDFMVDDSGDYLYAPA